MAPPADDKYARQIDPRANTCAKENRESSHHDSNKIKHPHVPSVHTSTSKHQPTLSHNVHRRCPSLTAKLFDLTACATRDSGEPPLLQSRGRSAHAKHQQQQRIPAHRVRPLVIVHFDSPSAAPAPLPPAPPPRKGRCAWVRHPSCAANGLRTVGERLCACISSQTREMNEHACHAHLAAVLYNFMFRVTRNSSASVRTCHDDDDSDDERVHLIGVKRGACSARLRSIATAPHGPRIAFSDNKTSNDVLVNQSPTERESLKAICGCCV